MNLGTALHLPPLRSVFPEQVMAGAASYAHELQTSISRVFLPFCAVIGATLLALLAWELWSARETNRVALQTSQELMQTGIELALSRVGSNVDATATWDDAVLQVHNRVDRRWVVENIGNWATDTLDFEFIVIVGPDDATKFVMIDGQVSNAQTQELFDDGLKELIKGVRANPSGPAATGLAQLGNRAAIVGAAAMRPHTDKLMPILDGHSILVYGDALDPLMVESIGQAYRISDLRLVRERPGSGGALQLGASDSPLAYLTWTPDRPGTRLLLIGLTMLAALIVAIGAFLVMIYFHARRNAAALLHARHLAESDSLTGLLNRRPLMDRLHQMVSDARLRGKLVAVFCVDLDGFKQVNDTFGHQCGDHILQTVAQRLQTLIRPSDTVARIGGDEFVILMEAANNSVVQEVAERLIQSLGVSCLIDGLTVPVSISAGVAISIGEGESPSDLLRRADVALYAAKRAGKNQYLVADTPKGQAESWQASATAA